MVDRCEITNSIGGFIWVKKCNKKLCKSCPLVYETDQYNFWNVNFDYKIRLF